MNLLPFSRAGGRTGAAERARSLRLRMSRAAWLCAGARNAGSIPALSFIPSTPHIGTNTAHCFSLSAGRRARVGTGRCPRPEDDRSKNKHKQESEKAAQAAFSLFFFTSGKFCATLLWIGNGKEDGQWRFMRFAIPPRAAAGERRSERGWKSFSWKRAFPDDCT